ncbi:MAG: tape measure protein [Rhodocyclaceae bacterium]|nr:tape measure protein [Rhodocyclaceae bacterium]
MNEIRFGIKLSYDGKEVTGGVTLNRDQMRQFAEEAKRASAAASSGFDGVGAAAKKSADQVEQAAERQRKSIKSAATETDLLGAAMKRMGGVAVGYFSVSAVVNFTRSLVDAQVQADKLKNSLVFSTGSQAKAAGEIDYLRKVSQDLGLDLGTAGSAYAKLQAAANGTALAGDKARAVFEAVSKASTVMGLSAEESNGALLAVSQMMSKGTVQAEELRGQLGERIPGAFQIAARAMNVTTAELGKMLEQGNVMAADFLPRFAAELERSLGDAPERAAGSMQAAINRMSSAWLDFRKGMNDTGVLSPVAAVMERLSVAMRGFSEGVAEAKRQGWNGAGAFFAGVGFGTTVETPSQQKASISGNGWREQRRAELQTQIDRGPMNYLDIGQIEEARRKLAALEAEMNQIRTGGRIKMPTREELAGEADKSFQATQQLFADLYTRWDSQLAQHLPSVAAKKAIEAYNKEFSVLKNSNPAAYQAGMAPLQKKLADAVKAEGAEAAAIADARMDAEERRIKEWHAEYRDTIKRALDESAVDYAGYWALVEAGERHLAEETIRFAQARMAAAQKRGDKPDVIKLQGEIVAGQARLNTGIIAEVGRGLAADTAKARTAGDNAHLDQVNADIKAMASAASWRRENLSLIEQELAVAREKSGADLRERMAQLDKNEALKHAPELLRRYKDEAQAQSAVTLAGIEAEIRARNEANASWQYGATAALQEYAREVGNAAGQTKRAVGELMKRAEDFVTEFAFNGKASIRDFATFAVKELYRIKVAQPAVKALASFGGSLFDGWFGSSSGTDSYSGDAGLAAMASVGGAHSGGLVGREATFTRNVPMTIFANAPRYHTGDVIGPGERPIIARDGEGVFTEGQMKKLAPAGAGGRSLVLHFSPTIDARQSSIGSASVIDAMLRQSEQRLRAMLIAEAGAGGEFAYATGRRK